MSKLTPAAARGTKTAEPYHHGNLRAALLEAAQSILAESGLEGLTLRACARRAGVSHAAPNHHFGNLAGLLAEFSAEGYERLASVMDATAADPAYDPLRAAGVGYIRFAMANPEHFRIMSRSETLDNGSARLLATRKAVIQRLYDALRAVYVHMHGHEPDESLLATRATLAWCCVHGYADLWVEGSLRGPDAPGMDAVLSELRPALVAP